jgi:hypothetical protein
MLKILSEASPISAENFFITLVLALAAFVFLPIGIKFYIRRKDRRRRRRGGSRRRTNKS